MSPQRECARLGLAPLLGPGQLKDKENSSRARRPNVLLWGTSVNDFPKLSRTRYEKLQPPLVVPANLFEPDPPRVPARTQSLPREGYGRT